MLRILCIRARRFASPIFALLLGAPSSASAQWHESFSADSAQFNSVYVLDQVGKPNTVLLGAEIVHWPLFYAGVFRTADFGRSWSERKVAPPALLVDFSFKDSRNGWLALKGDAVAPQSGVYKTSDGGLTWSAFPLLQGQISGITYCPLNGGLFATTFGSINHIPYNLASWDEGATWTELGPTSNRDQGKFRFVDSLHGIHTGFDDDIPKPGTYWYLTSDAGHSWSKLPIDSTSWDPVPIPGTSTWFAITRYGCVMRTDDNWQTWQTLYRFPQQQEHFPVFREHPCSSWMGGNGGLLFVQLTGGAYMSCDSGLSWISLNGPPSLSVEFTRSYCDGTHLFVPVQDTAEGHSVGKLCMLDLSNSVQSGWSGGSLKQSFGSGESAYVRCLIANDWTDSVKLLVTYDPDAFTWRRAVLPDGWLWRGTPSNGSIELTIIRPPGAKHDTTFELEFSTILSKPEAKIVVQPLAVYIDSLFLPCIAERPQTADTLTAIFDGDCATDLIWHFMQTGQIFDVLSIEPNPASRELRVVLDKRDEGAVEIEVSDVLGNRRMSVSTTDERPTLDVSSLPSGTYFLRFSEAGTIRTKRFVVGR